MLITTMNDIPGYTIEEVYGEVFGLTVRSRNIGSQMGAGLQVDPRRRAQGDDQGARAEPRRRDRAHGRGRPRRRERTRSSRCASTRPRWATRGRRSAPTGRRYASRSSDGSGGVPIMGRVVWVRIVSALVLASGGRRCAASGGDRSAAGADRDRAGARRPHRVPGRPGRRLVRGRRRQGPSSVTRASYAYPALGLGRRDRRGSRRSATTKAGEDGARAQASSRGVERLALRGRDHGRLGGVGKLGGDERSTTPAVRSRERASPTSRLSAAPMPSGGRRSATGGRSSSRATTSTGARPRGRRATRARRSRSTSP